MLNSLDAVNWISLKECEYCSIYMRICKTTQMTFHANFAEEGNKVRPVFILDIGVLKSMEKKLISLIVIILLSISLCHNSSDSSI